MEKSIMNLAVLSAVGFTLFVAHRVGDYWVQTDDQASKKGKPGNVGRLADLRHVASLTATKIVMLVLLIPLGLHLTVVGTTVGLGIDAVSHYWADRRTTLARLAKIIPGKVNFYNLADHGINGAHELDQSFHIAFLWVTAIIITVL